MTRPWIVLGGGGHASVVIDVLQLRGETVLGFTDPVQEHAPVLGIAWLGDDDVIARHDPARVLLASGVGSTASQRFRRSLYQRLVAQGYSFAPLVHPSAVVARSVRLGAGAQVMAGAVLQPNCRVGENVLVNTRVSVDHDCVIASHVHVAPGATLSGGVMVGEGSHIGTGASVIQGVRVGTESIVAAGALVIKDVPDGAVVMGIPAKRRVK